MGNITITKTNYTHNAKVYEKMRNDRWCIPRKLVGAIEELVRMFHGTLTVKPTV